jgi:hypothetical protein
MEEDDLGPPIDNVNLDEKEHFKMQNLVAPELVILEENSSLPESEAQLIKKSDVPHKGVKNRMSKGGSLKQVREPTILIEHDLKLKEDDIESIFTIEDKDYVEARRSIDPMPLSKAENNRYLEDGEEDLVKPSELFKAHRNKVKGTKKTS